MAPALGQTDDVGPAHERRIALINDTVAIFFGELEARVTRLAPEGLLEHLVLAHERVIFEQQLNELSIGTEVRCWGTTAEVEARLRASFPELTRTALASRFLIEYVVARPPSGTEHISIATYDQLLALADRIVDHGSLSDGIYYGVLGPEVTIDPVGGFTLHPGTDDAIADGFRADLARDAVASSLREEAVSGPIERYVVAWEQLENAFAAVEGFRFDDLMLALNALLTHVPDDRWPVPVIPVEAAIQMVARDRGWDAERAGRGACVLHP